MNWYTILLIGIGVIVGGAVGAFIHATIYSYRNKKTLISKRVDILPKFDNQLHRSFTENKLIISDGKRDYNYQSLNHVHIELFNKSEQDFEEFKFGITLSDDDLAIYTEAESLDRHHQIEQLTPLTLSEPKSTVNFTLHPFNRGDTYSWRLLVLTPEGRKCPGKINFSSPEPVHFLDLPTMTQLVERAAKRASLSLGVFQISLGK